MDDNKMTSLTSFVFVLVLSCSYCQELLHSSLSWSEANDRCNLSLNTENENDTIPHGFSVWIGKRWDFTNWIAIEDCEQYRLDSNLSTVLQIRGDDPLYECRDRCSRQFRSIHNRFGMQNINAVNCVCDNPAESPNFGHRFGGNCTPVRCRSDDVDSLDLCAVGQGLLVYNEMETDTFKGTGECAAFRRIDNTSFEGLALSCFETHGYLKETVNNGFAAISNPKLSWQNTLRTRKHVSKRTRKPRAWNNIPVEEWPLNTTLWVAVTRRSKLRRIYEECPPENCYCVAAHIAAANGKLTEKLMDCSTPLPALCMEGSIRNIAQNDSSYDDNTTAIYPGPPLKAFTVEIVIAIVASILVLILSFSVIIFALMRRYKRKQKTETTDEPRPTSIYYSEIRSAKSVKINNYKEDDRKRKEGISNNFDNGEYDQIGRANKFRDISLEDETYSHARKPKEFDSKECHTKTDADNNLYDHAS